MSGVCSSPQLVCLEVIQEVSLWGEIAVYLAQLLAVRGCFVAGHWPARDPKSSHQRDCNSSLYPAVTKPV